MDASGDDSVHELLRRSIDGDRSATESLCDRLRPGLRRWARGRLPAWARDGVDTDDLVQDALLRTVLEPGRLEPRPDFQAYIRQTVLNSIRDHVRRTMRRRRAAGEAPAADPDALSPIEELLGREKMARYEEGLERLPASDREMIVCRVDLGMSYQEIADATGRPSADAARMAVARAILRLSRELDHER